MKSPFPSPPSRITKSRKQHLKHHLRTSQLFFTYPGTNSSKISHELLPIFHPTKAPKYFKPSKMFLLQPFLLIQKTCLTGPRDMLDFPGVGGCLLRGRVKISTSKSSPKKYQLLQDPLNLVLSSSSLQISAPFSKKSKVCFTGEAQENEVTAVRSRWRSSSKSSPTL
jgi:hypothetical protein